MALHHVSPTQQRAVREFVRLERDFMTGYPLYWSPPDADICKQLSGRSAFFHDIEHSLFVAEHLGRPVARCAALINRRWQSSHQADTTGFIGYLAARPDAAAATAEVLTGAEWWLAERGMTRVIAPVNGSAMLGMGLLTDAFDESPMYPNPWHPPYYRGFMEAAGYAARYPLWVYEIDFGSERYRNASQRMLSRAQYDLRPINKRRWWRDVQRLVELFNAGMRDEWEMQPFTAAEFKELFRPIWALIFDARVITQFAVDQGREIGFVIGVVDLVPLFRSFRGRMGPPQMLRLLRAGNIRTRGGAILGAILPEYRGRHIAMLVARFFHELQAMGFASGLYFPVNDANTASRGLAEAIGGHGRLLYHCFEKQFVEPR